MTIYLRLMLRGSHIHILQGYASDRHLEIFWKQFKIYKSGAFNRNSTLIVFTHPDTNIRHLFCIVLYVGSNSSV